MNIAQFGFYLLTGLIAGGLTCMALQGGLLTTALTHQSAASSKSNQWRVVILFTAARLASYTLLGLLLGLTGSLLRLSDGALLVFQIGAIVIMIATALNLLDVHPFFRRLTLQPPASIRAPLKRLKQSESWLAPVGLGAFTIFLPCGVTQAMILIAINSGHPAAGAATMFAFILGTTPVFLILGLGATVFQQRYGRVFRATVAGLLLLVSLYSVNGLLVAHGAAISWQRLAAGWPAFTQPQDQATVPVDRDGVQQVVITITNSGYQPRHVRVKAGVPVKLTLVSQDAYSCALSFRLPEFKISTLLQSNDQQSFVLNPTVKGSYPFACSMGMYTGTLEVI